MGKAILILVINLILPGIGTIISCYFVTTSVILEKQKRVTDDRLKIKSSFVFHRGQIRRRGCQLGLLQLLTFPLLLLGWLWALYTSIKIL
jgi:hypothetical protein